MRTGLAKHYPPLRSASLSYDIASLARDSDSDHDLEALLAQLWANPFQGCSTCLETSESKTRIDGFDVVLDDH